MPSFAKVTIVGNIGSDSELKYTPQGTANCKFSIAVNTKRGDKESVAWYRCTVWGKQAEAVTQYLTKGRQVYLEGRLSLEEYTTREGEKRTSLEVNASDVQLLGAREDGQAQAAAAVETQRPSNVRDLTQRKDSFVQSEVIDDDIPF